MMVTNLLRLVTRSALAACLLVPQIRDMVIADPPQRPSRSPNLLADEGSARTVDGSRCRSSVRGWADPHCIRPVEGNGEDENESGREEGEPQTRQEESADQEEEQPCHCPCYGRNAEGDLPSRERLHALSGQGRPKESIEEGFDVLDVRRDAVHLGSPEKLKQGNGNDPTRTSDLARGGPCFMDRGDGVTHSESRYQSVQVRPRPERAGPAPDHPHELQPAGSRPTQRLGETGMQRGPVGIEEHGREGTALEERHEEPVVEKQAEAAHRQPRF